MDENMNNLFSFTKLDDQIPDSEEFKSLVIDLEKGIFIVNGKNMEGIPLAENSGVLISYDKGKWNMMITRAHFYKSK